MSFPQLLFRVLEQIGGASGQLALGNKLKLPLYRRRLKAAIHSSRIAQMLASDNSKGCAGNDANEAATAK
jgi:hypothetical protein